MDKTIIQQVTSIVGKSFVISEPDKITAHGFTKERRPEIMVYPGSAEEVRQVAALAYDRKMPLVPVGGGSRIGRVLTPFREGIGLSLTRLNQVLEFEPDNLSVKVEAGVSNRELQGVLSRRKLFLPVFPDYSQSTVGGEAAADTGARKRYRYGSMSDYVLGVEFVSPGGQAAKTGGKTVKNVSGYDLTKLLAGSWGTMGIITAVTLKLKPVPEAETVMLAAFEDTSAAVQTARQIMKQKLAAVALSVLYCSSGKCDLFDVSAGAILMAALEGSREVVAAHRKRLQLVIDKQAARQYREYVEHQEIALLWEKYHSLRRQIQSGCSGLVMFDKRVVEKINDTLAWFDEYNAVIELDIGSGVLEFSLLDQKEPLPERLAGRWAGLQEQLGPGMRQSFSETGPQPLLARLSNSIDPHRIMFPANALLGGLKRG